MKNCIFISSCLVSCYYIESFLLRKQSNARLKSYVSVVVVRRAQSFKFNIFVCKLKIVNLALNLNL